MRGETLIIFTWIETFVGVFSSNVWASTDKGSGPSCHSSFGNALPEVGREGTYCVPSPPCVQRAPSGKRKGGWWRAGYKLTYLAIMQHTRAVSPRTSGDSGAKEDRNSTAEGGGPTFPCIRSRIEREAEGPSVEMGLLSIEAMAGSWVKGRGRGGTLRWLQAGLRDWCGRAAGGWGGRGSGAQ